MSFLIGVLVGYTLRGKHKLLIRVLVGCRFGNCAFGAES